MKELLKKVFKFETEEALKERASGKIVIKPSTIMFCIIAIFYLLSGIDLVPEAFIKPKIFGFIDDIIVLAGAALLVYNDIGGDLNATISSEQKEERKPARRVRQSVTRPVDAVESNATRPMDIQEPKDEDVPYSDSDTYPNIGDSSTAEGSSGDATTPTGSDTEFECDDSNIDALLKAIKERDQETGAH